MNIGRLGVWLSQEMLTAADAAAQARRIEGWGYGALWQPEAVGRNVLVHAGLLLAGTTTLVVATGIANIYARDAMACAAAQKTLAEASGGRFLLGTGRIAYSARRRRTTAQLRQAGCDHESLPRRHGRLDVHGAAPRR